MNATVFVVCLLFVLNIFPVVWTQLYTSCTDVLQTEGTVPDGEYVIILGNSMAVSLYCSGLKTRNPQTYITLKSGRSNNFASYYQNIGNTKDCGDAVPQKNNTAWGRTEYTRLKFNPSTSSIDLTDFQYTHQLGPNRICYGCAGDKFAANPKCPPMGRFKVSLAGTPFAIDDSVQWTWGGNFADGSSGGQPHIQKTSYIGCFQDHGDRLLPGKGITDKAMTVNTCIQHCSKSGFRYAGVEYGSECMCGNSHNKYPLAKESDCNKNCSGADKSHSCGGAWKISVYSTTTDQVIEGTCGGYPGYCYPALNTNPQQKAFKLTLAKSHPCFNSVCKNEATCIALTEDEYKCACQPGYVGSKCDQIMTVVTTSGSECPTGLQAEECSCNGQCTGARFDGDVCVVSTGKPKTTCRYDNPGHVILFNVAHSTNAYCPPETEIVGCSYWDSKGKRSGNGKGVMDTDSRKCSIANCPTCLVTARCKKYDCGCENNGMCSEVTGKCKCQEGYSGEHCETFDYCGYYEDTYKKTACPAGVCQAVPSSDIRAFGGDTAGDHCIFPFSYNDVTFTECVEENSVGPPYACSTYFDGKDDFIDVGNWSPGFTYSLAAWVQPQISDARRRTIVGGVGGCRDYGIFIQSGQFKAFYNSAYNTTCSSSFTGGKYIQGQWYLVGVSNNGTHLSLFVNGVLKNVDKVQPYRVTTTTGLRIGNSNCCKGETFKGYIKLEALYGGLVAHYELGHDVNLPCNGIDHGGDDWQVRNSQQLSGIHCNVTRFYIPKGVTASIKPHSAGFSGTFEVYALDIQIDGMLYGIGSGYAGGTAPQSSGEDGKQGESFSGLGATSTKSNRGGGGGGAGGHTNKQGVGRPGAGGGYSVKGQLPIKKANSGNGWPVGGDTYGDSSLSVLYLGSGGGSGGNAKDLSKTPKGGRGGSGGGAVGLYASRTVTITGIVSVAGENGQGDVVSSPGCKSCPLVCEDQKGCKGNSNKACWDMSGPGGGGSGGSVYISGQLVDIGHDRIWARGGNGGYGAAAGCGGDGGRGRIHVDAQIFKGYVEQTQNGFLHTLISNTAYKDLSIPGQKLINPQSAVWGNEVFIGCFQDDTKNRHFSTRVGQSQEVAKTMTPQTCISLCRKMNLKFAAVEYGRECFCDNGYDISLKKPDGDCNMPCAGDKQQFCGAAHRMLIFGPHPLTQSKGFNGVVQKCQPWCVTADTDTSDPKWGVCDLNSKTSSSYKIHCQCPPGKMGTSCDQNCHNSTWGLNCRNTCNCNMTNTAECNAIDGSCHCKAGFTGDQCQSVCQTGTYGENCQGKCNCKETEECDQTNGKCNCIAGWIGKDCNLPCSPTFYGPNCAQKCNCFHGSCSPESGQCNCYPGYKLPFCSEECDPYNYGPNCMSDCDCSSQGCNRITGVCNCGPGLAGSKCEKNCPHGTWGQDCSKKCACENNGGCDGATGQCNCPPGFVGESCSTPCTNGTYGQNCLQTCQCEANQWTGCDTVTGRCSCKPGFQGNHCDQPCSIGTYGAGCSQVCSCRNKAPCDPVSGKCLCLPGFLGAQCEQACPDGKYGTDCSKSCNKCPAGSICEKSNGTCTCQNGNCNCPPGFFGQNCKTVCSCIHGDCNPKNGACTCLPGWTGTICDKKCPANKYGKNCGGQCQCKRGSCDFIDGYCVCPPGYTGNKCELNCQNGTYGVDCATPCPYCAHASGCDPVNGTCICSSGYLGVQCDQPCPTGFYGNGCKQSCSCSANGDCSSVDGTCKCKPGFMGPKCNQTCAADKWGPGCINSCDCPSHATGCDKSTGLCKCTPGFTGVKCIQSCVQGLWGQDCGSDCKCNLTTSYCSPLDGSCHCRPGYTGAYCGQACPVGTWGTDCSQTCLCNDHGVCDHVTGSCNCIEGYTGTTCEKQCNQDLLWGKNCAFPCNCNGHHCDHRNGKCLCPAGKKGNQCEQDCESNYFGFQCAQPCMCKNGAKCDAVSGECECPVGFTGKICDQACPPGRYGEGCKLTCTCLNGGSCDQTGTCSCADGFSGKTCNISCAAGTWGKNCANKCSPSCPAGCLSDTGDCNCQPWTCLNGGTCGSDGRCQCTDRFEDLYCSTNIGRDQQSVSKTFTFSLSGGEIAGIAIATVVVIVLIAVLSGFLMRRRFMATAGAGTQVKFDSSQTVEIDSGLPSKSNEADEDNSRGFSNPLAEDSELSSFTELSRKPDNSDA